MATWLQPVAKSMILCEDVLPGPPGTANVHLMNVFSAIRPRSTPPYPFRLAQLCVFLQLTDAEGEAPGQIVARRAESDHVLFASQKNHIRFEDRLQSKWVLFRITDCPFPGPGLYFIEFHCADRWVADQPVFLVG
jgi:hypothetical protein